MRQQQRPGIRHKKINFVPLILIRNLVNPLMKLPKEVGSKQKRVCLIFCRFFLRKEKYYFLDCSQRFPLQRKSENINALIESRFNIRTGNEEFNQYDDLLKLFLDNTQY